MTPLVTDFPEEPAELAGWLEDILVRGDIAQLAAELEVVQGEPAAELALDQAIPLASVQRRGFRALPHADLKKLLAHPRLLVELARQVYVEGGSYWDERLASAPGMAERVHAGHARLQQRLGRPAAPLPLAEIVPVRDKRRWFGSPWLAAGLTAVAVLAAVAFIPQVGRRVVPAPPVPEVAARWGWLKVDDVPKNLPPAEFRTRLAVLIEEADQHRPENPAALAQWITELRLGCARVQMLQATPLEKLEEKWLREKCRDWAKKFDQYLADAEAGGQVDKVRTEVSAAVHQIARVLREKSHELRPV